MKTGSYCDSNAGRALSSGLVIAATCLSSHSQSFFSPKAELWRTDGPVYGLSCLDRTLYLGGEFSYVGPPSGSAGIANQADGQAIAGFPVINGSIATLVADGAGGWFIGGSFTKVSELSRSNLVHILNDHTVDLAWAPQPNDGCTTLVLAGTELYVGGTFARIGGLTRSRLACLDCATGQPTAWNPGANSTVNAIAVSDSTVYIGGTFATVGNQNRTRIAALERGTGKVLSWNPGANNTVNTLTLSSNRVYAGGLFTTIGNKPRNRVAALDISTGVATDWNPSANGAVQSLVMGVETVYAGGTFTSIGGQNRSRLAALDIGSGTAKTWTPEPDGAVYALALAGAGLYVGGDFTGISGQTRSALAVVDPTTGQVLDWNPLISNFTSKSTPTVYTVMATGGFVAFGSNFASFGGAARRNLAALDTATGVVLDWNPSPNSLVTALQASSNRVYIGGTFTNIAGVARSRIAALNPESGAADEWDPEILGRNASVQSFALDTDALYVGGIFTNIGHSARTSLAALNLATGEATDFNNRVLGANNTPGVVNCLALIDDVLFVGGDFRTIGGQVRQRLAALDLTVGSPIAWDPGANGAVTSLGVCSNWCYVAGVFTSAGGQSRNGLAALDLVTGAASPWNPEAGGLNARVNALHFHGDRLYVGGQYSALGGEFRNRLGSVQVASGQATPWDPNPNALIRALEVTADTVYVGGEFTKVGDQVQAYLAAFSLEPVFLLSSAKMQGAFSVQFYTGDGRQVEVQASANLQQWEPLGTQEAASQIVEFTDPMPGFLSHRFYRLILAPPSE
jgi:hypothetical protein